MRIRILAMALLVLTGLVLSGPAARAEEDLEEGSIEKALTAATDWLALVDRSEMSASWDHTAALFRQAVSREQWIKKITAARAPLGKRVWRKVILTKYETQLPAAPPGEYVVIQFKTVFENAALTVETVTPMKDPDGEWRVSGYYIK